MFGWRELCFKPNRLWYGRVQRALGVSAWGASGVVVAAEEGLTGVFAENWFAVVIVYAIGLATGWRLARGRFFPLTPLFPPKGDEEDAAEKPAAAAGDLDILEKELAALRALVLEDGEKDDAEALERLDEAVKRANGRLKLIAQAVERAEAKE